MSSTGSVTQGHAAHFESLATQRSAGRLGTWAFLVSEVLLFAGLFTLYAAYRFHDPVGFHAAAAHSNKLLGSINTAVLLVSSTSVALGVHALRRGAAGRACLYVGGTVTLAACFLAIKLIEYRGHLAEGLRPGGGPFWTLYYTTTGLHAVHVAVGALVLLVVLVRVAGRHLTAERADVLENAALYWHLVDVVWVFLWPLYYLT